MEENIVVMTGEGEQLSITKDAVFLQIRCERDNPLYETYSEEYEELLPRILGLVRPRAAMGFFRYPEGLSGRIAAGKEVLYLIMTVGAEVTQLVSSYFEEGDYVRGMLADAMSSAAIGAFEAPVLRRLRKLCQEKGVGIKKRYEAPGHVPMAIQRVAYDALNAKETLGLSISEGFMYEPVKSTCQVFEISENPRVLNLTHGCSDCSNTDCPNRRESALITVKDKGGDYEIAAVFGSNLLSALSESELMISSPCGGVGRCGKCAIRVLSGDIAITPDSQRFFSQKELAEGKRLACQSVIAGDCTIEVLSAEETELLAVGSLSRTEPAGEEKTQEEAGIAVDIGTTTLAFALVSLTDGQIIASHTSINHQRRYGGDVITRIEAAGSGKAQELTASIRRDILDGLAHLLKNSGIIQREKTKTKGEAKKIRVAAIAGNTTMLHLLMGYPTQGLGVYPFTAHSLKLEERSLKEILGEEWGKGPLEIPSELSALAVYLFPGFSVFVGADIVSGVYSLDLHKSAEINALIDLGTNGEMAIGNRERLLVTSTAAGPAFEGGNISCGVGSITGAISNVTIKTNEIPNVMIRTIGDGEALGICGTGVIETAAELIRNNLIDETGVLDEEYFEEGFPLAEKKNGERILFTQRDVRELQLAKSAIRAGLEVLLQRYGAGYAELNRLYIAGGFGYYLDARKAAQIGLIPEQLLEKTEAVGNSSLNGAVRFLREWKNASRASRNGSSPAAGEDPVKELTQLAQRGEEIALSSDRDFNDLYMEHMMFDA